MPLVIAAADIGSNTAHLLVAEVVQGKLKRLVNESEWLSLGEVVGRLGSIPKKESDRLVERVADFVKSAELQKADRFYLFATEAMRRAANHDQVVKEIERRTGVKVDIIDGKRETELSLRAVTLDSHGPDPFFLVEMGGGSMQIAFCGGGRVLEGQSLPLGTGTLVARIGLEQPPTESQLKALQDTVDEAVQDIDDMGIGRRVVATGGVVRGIWRALHPDGDKTIAVEELDHLIWDTKRLYSSQIVSRYGVKPKRAQTLLPGATAYATVLRAVGQKEMSVSEYGVREGAVLEIADGMGRL